MQRPVFWCRIKHSLYVHWDKLSDGRWEFTCRKCGKSHVIDGRV